MFKPTSPPIPRRSEPLRGQHHVWQPGDHTRYELVVFELPAGDRVLHWINGGRSTRQGEDPRPMRLRASFDPRAHDAPKRLARIGRLVEYDAWALCAFLVEIGYPHVDPGRFDRGEFFEGN